MYLGLTVLVCWTMHAEIKPIWYYLTIFLSISWGVMMEIFQFAMHLGRSFDYFDILGNSAGTFLGVLIYIGLVQIKKNNDIQSSINR